MLKYLRAKFRIVPVLAFTLSAFMLLFQFNNCGGKINSQMLDSSSVSGQSTGGTSDTSNPYVLQCIQSSDGSKVANTLKTSVLQRTGGNNKINSLDWDQSIDLVITLDNECVYRTNFSEAIMAYVDTNKISRDFKTSAYVVKKEDVKNLDLFIKNALDSECLISTGKNYQLKISGSNPDPYFNYQTHLLMANQNPVAISANATVMDAIQAYENDPAAGTHDKVAKVAVIDTGFDNANPDLAPILARSAIDNSPLGANTIDGDGVTFLTDSGWHGTHVTGLIAAQYNNGIGVSGVAGRNVALYPLKASNDGSNFTVASVYNALQKAIAFKVDIINMSLSTANDINEFRTGINAALAAGITVVVAAGNGDSSGIGRVLGSNTAASEILAYPAMYSTSSNAVITVGSVDLATTTISGFSNRSPTYVDVLAPGSNANATSDLLKGIVSTLPMSINLGWSQFSSDQANLLPSTGTGVGSLVLNKDPTTGALTGTAEVVQGTSMATPIVTGALANIISMAKSRGKILSNTQLKAWLKGSGSPKSAAFTNYSISGSYLNLQQLSNYAIANIPSLPGDGSGGTTPTPSPTPAPTPTPTTPPATILEIVTQPISKQAVIGESVQLTVEATAVSNLTYQWYKNNVAITGATSKTLSLSNIQKTDAGAYKVSLMTIGKTLISNTAEVKVALSYCN